MAIVEKKYFEDGEVVTSGDLNANYVTTSLGTLSMNEDNMAPGWITRTHMAGTDEVNDLFVKARQSLVTYTTSAWQLLTTTTADTALLDLNYSPVVGEVLRVQGGGLVGTFPDLDDTWDVAGSANGQWNYYGFRILLEYQDSGVTGYEELGYWGYSITPDAYNQFSGSTHGRNSPATTTWGGAGSIMTGTINNQTFQFSTLHRNGVEGRVYVKLHMQVQIVNPANKIEIERWNMLAVRVRG